MKKSDITIVCLSENSVNKRGFVQKEIRFALDVADEQPEGLIFLIPLRLEECAVPERLGSKQWVDYFKSDGYERLMKALGARAQELGVKAPNFTRSVAYNQDAPFHGQGTYSIGRVRRWLIYLRTHAVAVIALLTAGLLLISIISVVSQRIRGRQELGGAAFEKELARLNQPAESAQPNQPSEIDFTLYPNMVRGDGERSTIISPTGVKILRLHLLLLADKYQSYQGELLTEDRTPFLLVTNLRSGIQDDRRAVIMRFPAQGLPAGDYRVELSGKTDDGQAQEIAAYYFRIVHR